MPLITKDGVLLTANGEFLNNKSIADVQVNGATVVEDGVANIPIAKQGYLGVIKRYSAEGGGVTIDSTGAIQTARATDAQIAARTNNYQPIVPSNLQKAVDSVLCSTNSEEALTESQQEAAKDRLGIEDGITDVTIRDSSIVSDGVAALPIGTVDILGVIKLYGQNSCGLKPSPVGDGAVIVAMASDEQITGRSNNYRPIVPGNLVQAVNSVLCSASASEALTSDQKYAFWNRVEKPWVLKGTMTGATVTVDLSGCTEFILYGTITGTGAGSLSVLPGDKNIVGTFIREGVAFNFAWFRQEAGIFHPVDVRYGSGTAATIELNAYARTDIDLGSITGFKVGSSLFSSSDIKIYAR